MMLYWLLTHTSRCHLCNKKCIIISSSLMHCMQHSEVRNLSFFVSICGAIVQCCNLNVWTSFIHSTSILRRTSWSRWETSCAVVDGDLSTSPTWWTNWATAASSVAAGTTTCATTTRARRAPGQSTTATRRLCRGRPHPHQKMRGAKKAKARERDKTIIIK